MTVSQRARAVHTILDYADVGVGIVSAEEVDRLNILQATLFAMRDAINDLPRRPDLVLVDGPHAPRIDIPCWPIVQGDRRSYIIGCASIVAKVLRDYLMQFYHDLYPRYGFARHKGYGTVQHANALASLGPTILHRFSFRPVAAQYLASGTKGVAPRFTVAMPARVNLPWMD